MCKEVDQSFGNVTSVFIKHNQKYSLGLKVRFIQVQEYPGSKLYRSFSLELGKSSFWITDATCAKNEWCQLSNEGM